MYLHLTDKIYQREDAGLFIGMPPVRTARGRDAIWKALKDGEVETIASDHAPWTRQQKMDPGWNIHNPRGGVNNLQVMLPMLMNEVNEGKISLQQFVDLTSANAAKRFGIYPHKGVIAEGAHADLAVWDLDADKTIDNEGFSNAGYSIYAGTEIKGWPRMTICRGQVVFENGKIVRQSGGRLVQRKAG